MTVRKVGTIAGVIKGYRWMVKQNWNIVDRYRNTTGEDMPMDETITNFADQVIDLAERVIIEHAGQGQYINGQVVYHIPLQKPTVIFPLSDLAEQVTHLRSEMKSEIQSTVVNQDNEQKLAFARIKAANQDGARK